MLSHTLSIVIAVVASLNVLGCGWLIWWTARSRPEEVSKGEVIDHVWDGDLQERNNPMPRWWLILFFLSIIFCFLYFLLYPALGSFGNVLGWSKASQYEQEMAAAKKQYAPLYAAFAGRPIEDLAKDPKALVLGRSLFAQQLHCTATGRMHAARPGFPISPIMIGCTAASRQKIVETITHGREGIMPAARRRLGRSGRG